MQTTPDQADLFGAKPTDPGRPTVLQSRSILVRSKIPGCEYAIRRRSAPQDGARKEALARLVEDCLRANGLKMRTGSLIDH